VSRASGVSRRSVRFVCPAAMWLASACIASAQQPARFASCAADGRRVLAQRWDSVLGRGWDLVEDCAHPERPARLIASASTAETAMVKTLGGTPLIAALSPLLVHAGEGVRLWQQSRNVRIEMLGVAEQSARIGEHVVIRITRRTDDAGLTVQRIDGTVRGAADVEMER